LHEKIVSIGEGTGGTRRLIFSSLTQQWSYFTRGTFILAALVLSNAYKGQNVFNLVANRKSIPYHYFSQLVDDKFKIYGGSYAPEIVVYYCKHESYRESKLFKNKLLTISRTEVRSEVYDLDTQIRINRSTYLRRMPKEKTRLLQFVANHTALLPTTVETLNKSCEEVYPPNSTHKREEKMGWITLFGWGGEMMLPFLKWQKIHSLGFMKRCDRLALVAPDYWSSHVAKTLRKVVPKTKDVYLGKEVLYERLFFNKLMFFVRLSTMKRIKAMGSSGILDFWLNIFRPRVGFDDDAESRTIQTNYGRKHFGRVQSAFGWVGDWNLILFYRS